VGLDSVFEQQACIKTDGQTFCPGNPKAIIVTPLFAVFFSAQHIVYVRVELFDLRDTVTHTLEFLPDL